MNMLHLKYAVEIERARYLNRAAENLYMAQPNLSRALKELEETLGITIFTRSPKGMLPTPQGEAFLQDARRILKQIDEMEGRYTGGQGKKQIFSVSVPRASYISYAFAKFAAGVQPAGAYSLFYKETNALRAIDNILHGDYRLGIIRYQRRYDKHFQELLQDKGLISELIADFSYVLLMSRSHPLADETHITYASLGAYTEIAHADPYVPSLSMATVRREELPEETERRIYVFERASQFDLLTMVPGTYMRVSPLPDDLLNKYELIQKKCDGDTRRYRDVLIYHRDYHLSKLDRQFITQVCSMKRSLF